MTLFPTPLYLLFFSSTLLAVLSPWLPRLSVYIFSAMALGFAFHLGHLTLIGFVSLVLCSILFQLYIQASLPKSLKVVLFFLITTLMLCFFQHKIPGFHNWKMIDLVKISPSAYPYSFYLNLDKCFAALLLLIAITSHHPLSLLSWSKSLPYGIVYGISATCILMPIAMMTGFVTIDVKIHPTWIIWTLSNLVLVCMAEEVFFRKFLQSELSKAFKFGGGGTAAIFISALIFGAAHFQGGPIYIVLSTIAGVFYGIVYKQTGRIEASILTHFTVNALHFFFFSYPALMPT